MTLLNGSKVAIPFKVLQYRDTYVPQFFVRIASITRVSSMLSESIFSLELKWEPDKYFLCETASTSNVILSFYMSKQVVKQCSLLKLLRITQFCQYDSYRNRFRGDSLEKCVYRFESDVSNTDLPMRKYRNIIARF